MLRSIAFEANDILALGLNQENVILQGRYIAFPDFEARPIVYRIHHADPDWNPEEMVATGIIAVDALGKISIS